jgi:hypothetical protein
MEGGGCSKIATVGGPISANGEVVELRRGRAAPSGAGGGGLVAVELEHGCRSHVKSSSLCAGEI